MRRSKTYRIETKKIKHLLLDLGITQIELARRLGISQRMMNHVILGRRLCWPIRKKIARALGVSVEEICPSEEQDAA